MHCSVLVGSLWVQQSGRWVTKLSADCSDIVPYAAQCSLAGHHGEGYMGLSFHQLDLALECWRTALIALLGGAREWQYWK